MFENFGFTEILIFVLIGLLFVKEQLIDFLLTKFGGKKKEVKNSAASVTYEERLAYVEAKTLKLETNHIEHIQADVKEIKESISKIEDKLDKHSVQITRLEAKIEK